MAASTQTLRSDVGVPPNTYIYKILSTAPRPDPLTYSQTDKLAVLSSDDTLRFISPETLQVLPDGVIKDVNESVTCLERVDDEGNIVATAGRDGWLRFWDKRTSLKAWVMHSSEHKLISSLVCSSTTNFVACGIENTEDGPHPSPVLIWDPRKPIKPVLEYVESHTDTITDLQLHRDQANLLMSSSTDGLVNIFDTRQAEEDDALYQVINHGSAVAHAGFMYPSTDIYALGTNETVSFYSLQSMAEEEEEPTPKQYGDVRETLSCDYLAKMHWVGNQPALAGGKHSMDSFRLIPIHKNAASGPLEYLFDQERTILLPDGHGEEVIRDLFTDIHSQTTYTCGEDGFVRAWKMPSEEAMEVDEDTGVVNKKESRKEKKSKRKGDKDGASAGKDRYKPY